MFMLALSASICATVRDILKQIMAMGYIELFDPSIWNSDMPSLTKVCTMHTQKHVKHVCVALPLMQDQ